MGKETKVKKKKRGDTVLLGERDEEGKLLTPHTKYGLFRNMGYIIKKLWQCKKIFGIDYGARYNYPVHHAVFMELHSQVRD